MQTGDDGGDGVPEQTMPREIAGLDIEVQAMYERVSRGLGLDPAQCERIGRFELTGERLGMGGMGSVYRAYDTHLRRPVALKLVSARALTNVGKLRERLQYEAIVLAKLAHPNIVTLFDAGVDEARVFLAMELVEGETLRARQTRSDCSVTERLRLYAGAGRGLAAAHRTNVVHRDFKPDNVFVGPDGRARVGDFGLAYEIGEHEVTDVHKRADEGRAPSVSQLTQAGEYLGTMGYSAPEQLRGQRPDARSDQYSFCVSLWEALTGVRPYTGETREALLEAIESGEPCGAAELPGRLRRALAVGLSVQPQQRYPNMDAVVRVIEQELRRPARVRQIAVFGIAATIALAGTGALWFAHKTTSPPCPLADEFAGQVSRDAWAQFAEALPSAAARFESELEQLEAEARAVCMDSRESARAQQLRALARSLDRLPSYAPAHFDKFSREFESALVAGPTRMLTPAVETFVATKIEPLEQELDPSKLDRAYADIIAVTTTGLDDVAETLVDRAELRLRRGRARSMHADYELAIDDFRTARRLAERTGDNERRLQAHIEAAKTVIMRLQQFERGAEWIASARDLLAAVPEPISSLRRAALDEIDATLIRHEATPDSDDPAELERALTLQRRALTLQRRALLRDMFAGRRFDLVPRFVNLGHIHQALGRPRAAERCYRAALSIDDADLEARLNLAQLWVNELDLFNKPEQANKLLDGLLASEMRDTQLAAALIALQLAVQSDDDRSMIERRRVTLSELLDSGHPGTPTHMLQSRYYMVLAYARERKLGPDFQAALDRLLPELSADERTQLELDLTEILGPERTPLVLEQIESP